MKNTGAYLRVHVDTAAVSAVGHAGGVLLRETIRATGLDRALSSALRPRRKPLATHDPAKVVLDLAVTLALGGDALSAIATVRAESGQPLVAVLEERPFVREVAIAAMPKVRLSP